MNDSESNIKQPSVIMVADIKSFAKKMMSDERAAFELLKTYDEIMRGLVAQFGGIVVKTLGDYFNVLFFNPIDSLKCAIEIQKRFWSFNLGKLDFESIEVRIGIHSGAIVIEHGKTSGEAIETASRIEALTEPKRICISGNVYDLLKGKITFQAFPMGAIEQKSTGGELSIYEILIESIAEFARPSERARQKLTKNIIKELNERGDEEVKEAEALEEVKERSIRNRPENTDVKKQIEASYLKAETYYKGGFFQDAEKEIDTIYKHYPNYGDTDDHKKEEEENERRADERITKAREYMQEGNYDAAETEINRVFHVFPLHLEAQRAAQEIEDKRAEEKCAPRLIKARGLFVQGNLDNAEAELKEIFNVLPEHANAQLLARQISAARLKLKEEERVRHAVEETLTLAKLEKDQLIKDILDKAGKKSDTSSSRGGLVSPGNVLDKSAPLIPPVKNEPPHEKSEAEIVELNKIIPTFQDQVKPLDEEEEKTQRANILLERAHTLLQQGDLDAADREINAVFQIFPWHTGAQQILIQIEDARYKKENDERALKIEKSRKIESLKGNNYIQEHLIKARIMLEAGDFAELTFILHDIFKLDPNHEGARQLQADLQKAKEEKAIRRRAEADQAERERRSKKVLIAQKKNVVQHMQKIEKAELDSKTLKYRFFFRLTALCIAVCVLWIAGRWAYRYLFPATVSIAVLDFIPSDTGTDADISCILPLFLKDDFARCEHVITVASTSQNILDPKAFIYSKNRIKLGVQYFLTGNVQHQGNQYTITAVIIDATTHHTEYKVSFSGEITALPRYRIAIVRSVLQYLDIETVLPDIPSGYFSPEAYQKYLSAFHLIRRHTVPCLDSAKTLLRQCIEHNKIFTAAEVLLAQAEIASYTLGGDNAQTLKEAFDLAQHALLSTAYAADAYRVIGEYYFFTRQFDSAIKNVQTSLELQPSNGQSYRDLSRSFLGCGDFEAASRYATMSYNVEPVNSESYLLLGLVKHFQKEYTTAATFYQQAIQWGANDSLVTSQYLTLVWDMLGQSDKVAAFWKDQISRCPKDYRSYYSIGRAYQKVLNIPILEQTHLYQDAFTEGLRLAHQVLEINPDDPFAHAYAALFHSRLGAFKDGETEIEKALELEPVSAKIHYLAADVYSIQKDSPRAFAALKQAVAIQYDPTEILNPDLILIRDDAEFISITTKPILSSAVETK
jgi:class 3 adenylate cyclase/Tfp pilus assembly protein PilF/TolB-like protein